MLFKDKYIKNKAITKNYYFYLGIFSGISLFIFLSYQIYGVLTFNPQFVYGTSGMLSSYLGGETSFINFLIENFKNLINVFFTKEFGIFWFSPIIFAGLVLNVLLVFIEKNRIPFLISLLMYGQIFAIVLMWKSTASSYGFRYLFNLLPLSIIIVFYFINTYNNKIVYNYLFFFSFMGILSLFFFETTELTQLSTTDEMNSFGRVLRFTEPNYLEGFFKSFLDINSYLKIFTTSFLGAISFKLLFIFVNSSSLIKFLSGLGLPVENPDFIEYVEKVETIESLKFFIIILFLFYFSQRFVQKSSK